MLYPSAYARAVIKFVQAFLELTGLAVSSGPYARLPRFPASHLDGCISHLGPLGDCYKFFTNPVSIPHLKVL